MNINKVGIGAAGIALVSLASSVSAQVTLTGSQLQGLQYSNTAPGFIPVPGPPVYAAATYVSTGSGYVNLSTPDGNQGLQLATVTVPNGYDGASFGTLNNLVANTGAGQMSFDLASVSVANGQSPFWQITLADPKNTSSVMVFDTIEAAPDKTSGQPTIGANYFNQGGSSMATIGSLDGNIPFLWSVIATQHGDDGSLYGTWQVVSVGIGVGGQQTTDPLDVTIDSITLPGDPSVPDAASTLPLLGAVLLGMTAIKRKFQN